MDLVSVDAVGTAAPTDFEEKLFGTLHSRTKVLLSWDF